MPTFAVLGAGGKTGQECVQEGVRKGFNVRAIVRSPDKYKERLTAIAAGQLGSVDVVAADVTDSSSLAEALKGCNAGVIFAASGTGYWSAKSVDFEGVRNVALAASRTQGVGRVVLVSSCLVTPKNRFHPLRILLNNMRWGLMDNKFKGEEALRASGHSYCIVRPGGLTVGPQGQATLKAQQGDSKSGMVARADVAAVCVAALQDAKAGNVTLELMGEKDGGVGVKPLAEQLKTIFDGLKQDS